MRRLPFGCLCGLWKSLPPLGGKVARYAPDEGEMPGKRNKPNRKIAIAVIPRAGHALPLPRNDFLLPRRGGVTPPRRGNGR